jgi:heterodisulfide reductase subunit A
VSRSGVFLCECGGNISGVLDLPALAARGRALDGVVDVHVCQFLCGAEGRRLIEGVVASRGLDRIVIGACSRRFQGPTFERIARDLELGENTVAFANLREGCAFIHRQEPARAQRKAETVLAAAVARAAHQLPLEASRTFLNRSALVVGGGIGGLSAAEELSAAGIEVHLVEREQSLGGYMARLSKTFPTEDCAMCSLGPRLANAATDPRIHVDTLSEVTSVSGPPGEFRVRVLHRPRFVSDQCVGCGACAAACPVELESEFDLGVTTRKAISRPFANAIPPTFAIDHRGWAPCTSACPAHTAAQGYIALAAQGRWAEAYRVASAPNPFPSVCGRICPHACEEACTRGRLDEPVAIAGIKRFVADLVGAAAPVQAGAPRFEERVAVVGAGPAGLTAARDLALLGYPVTVLEAQPCAGGMLRLGVPEFRLPREVVASEVERVLAHGVTLQTGRRCGRDFTVDSLLASGYRAVLLALGLQRPRPLPLDGRGLAGVLSGVELLRARALGETVDVGPRVVVIGGGDVAVDAARTALRLGAERVTLASIEGRDTLPAQPAELAEALAEGVVLAPSLMPVALLGGAAVTGVRLQPCTLGDADARGWRPPLPADGEPLELEAETVVLCVGQELDEAALEGATGVVVTDGQIAVDAATMMTGRPGVFAAGDAAPSGGLIAIQAVAAGARAARAIHNHLRGETLVQVWPVESPRAEVSELELNRLPTRPREEMRVLPPDQRRRSWDEVRAGFTEEEALTEARRCLACGGCAECGSCATACPAGAIDLTQQPWEEELTVGAIVIATGHREFDARRKPPLGYGRYANVLTQSQLARLLSASGPTGGELRRPSDGQVPQRVFMLQCVGSRDSTSRGNPHCSAICCLFATLHASLIRESYPDTRVTVAYTDLRMPGKAHEEYLRLVAERGVRYVRSRVGEISEEPDKSLRVRWEDTTTGGKTEELYDLVVLSAGLEASEGTTQIARVAGLQQGTAGFLKEYHPKLRPVDSQRSGIFIAGTAQGPKGIPETIAQAKAAAARVTSMLQGGMAMTPVEVAYSDPSICIGCAVCVSVCPQGAVRLLDGDRPHAVVDPASCRGCGICAAECPSGAMTVGGFSDAELLAEAMA